MRSKMMVGGLIAGVMLVSAGEVEAQFSGGNEGICEHPYEIMSNGTLRGYAVVVEPGCTTLTTGYTAGKDHVTWTAGPAWPGSFILDPISTTPTYSSYSWEKYDFGAFDLDTSSGFPSISPGVDDEFYKVLEGDTATPPNLTHVGYMWLKDGSPLTQEWYGLDGVLLNDLIGDPGSVIKFQSVQVPSANSVDINPLCDGYCP